MSETKEDIASERDALRAENENLRGQLAAAGATRPGLRPPAQHRFQLSEGDRQELEIRGFINVGGRLLSKAEVLELISGTGSDAQGNNDQSGVQIADAPEGTRIDPGTLPTRTGPGVAGVDFVYPSVERGKIDPALAGTPGISGPPAQD